MKFQDMLKKAKESGGSPGSPAPATPPPIQPPGGGIPAGRTHLTADEKEIQAELERDQAILQKKYPKMHKRLEENNGILEGGGLDLSS